MKVFRNQGREGRRVELCVELGISVQLALPKMMLLSLILAQKGEIYADVKSHFVPATRRTIYQRSSAQRA